MTEKAWKKTGRAIAGRLGGKLVPVTGKKGAPDVTAPWQTPVERGE